MNMASLYLMVKALEQRVKKLEDAAEDYNTESSVIGFEVSDDDEFDEDAPEYRTGPDRRDFPWMG